PQMQRVENFGLFFRSWVTGYILRAYNLKRKRYGRRQHQQCVDRRCVCEPGGSKQSCGNDVVQQVGDAYQPRSGQQRDTSTEKFLPESSALRRRKCGGGVERESGPELAEKGHRLSDAVTLEQCQMHNREHSVSGRTREIVETLLLHPNRKPNRK